MKCKTQNCFNRATDNGFCTRCNDELFGSPITFEEFFQSQPTSFKAVILTILITALLIWGLVIAKIIIWALGVEAKAQTTYVPDTAKTVTVIIHPSPQNSARNINHFLYLQSGKIDKYNFGYDTLKTFPIANWPDSCLVWATAYDVDSKLESAPCKTIKVVKQHVPQIPITPLIYYTIGVNDIYQKWIKSGPISVRDNFLGLWGWNEGNKNTASITSNEELILGGDYEIRLDQVLIWPLSTGEVEFKLISQETEFKFNIGKYFSDVNNFTSLSFPINIPISEYKVQLITNGINVILGGGGALTITSISTIAPSSPSLEIKWD